MELLVPLAGVRDPGRVRPLQQRSRIWWVIPGGFVRGRHCGFGQAGVVRGDQAFHVTAQVVPQMPPVGDLHSVGRAVPGAVGVPTGPVSADHLYAGMETEPVGEIGGFSAQEHVDRSVPVGQVDEHGAVLVAAAQRELVDAEDRHLAD